MPGSRKSGPPPPGNHPLVRGARTGGQRGSIVAVRSAPRRRSSTRGCGEPVRRRHPTRSDVSPSNSRRRDDAAIPLLCSPPVYHRTHHHHVPQPPRRSPPTDFLGPAHFRTHVSRIVTSLLSRGCIPRSTTRQLPTAQHAAARPPICGPDTPTDPRAMERGRGLQETRGYPRLPLTPPPS